MKKVLVVDDQADMRRLLSITLGNDYEMIEASNGEDAIAMAQLHKPDAILLDVMMYGEFDGLQVLSRIRKSTLGQQPLIIMVTALGQAAQSNKARELGADAYFIKPFSPLKIIHWLSQKLG